MSGAGAQAHSLLGASGAHRWMNCPGSFQLSVTTPARPASIHAVTGTLAHNYIESALRETLNFGDKRADGVRIPQSELGQEWSLEGHTVIVDQALIDGVNVMLDYVHTVRAHSDWINVEFQVELDAYFQKPPPVSMFGRVDVAVVDMDTGTLEVIDYKNGAGVRVSPADNPQLLYYAAGVLLQLPRNQRRRVDHVRLTVVQPNFPGTEPIRSWDTGTIDVLLWVADKLVPAVEKCERDNAPLVPGDWCRFCPALHVCPRLMQDAITMAKAEFTDVKLPENPAELANSLDIAERAMTWAKAVQEFALEQLQRQVHIPGWEMVPTRPTRKWVDDDAIVIDTLRDLGVDDEVILETGLRSPPRLEKALIRTTWGRQIWADHIDDLMVRPVSSGMKLARSAKADAREDFANADGH